MRDVPPTDRHRGVGRDGHAARPSAAAQDVSRAPLEARAREAAGEGLRRRRLERLEGGHPSAWAGLRTLRAHSPSTPAATSSSSTAPGENPDVRLRGRRPLRRLQLGRGRGGAGRAAAPRAPLPDPGDRRGRVSPRRPRPPDARGISRPRGGLAGPGPDRRRDAPLLRAARARLGRSPGTRRRSPAARPVRGGIRRTPARVLYFAFIDPS
jgi:hypothetical protein